MGHKLYHLVNVPGDSTPGDEGGPRQIRFVLYSAQDSDHNSNGLSWLAFNQDFGKMLEFLNMYYLANPANRFNDILVSLDVFGVWFNFESETYKDLAALFKIQFGAKQIDAGDFDEVLRKDDFHPIFTDKVKAKP